jgi:hypothetical protein
MKIDKKISDADYNEKLDGKFYEAIDIFLDNRTDVIRELKISNEMSHDEKFALIICNPEIGAQFTIFVFGQLESVR